MTTIAQKVDYVKRATTGDTGHHCHWPGCGKAVPPAMWGCKQHWFQLPLALRNRIWATYRPGQEVSKTPSTAYLAVADEVQKWIATHNAQADAPPVGGRGRAQS